ncbi:MAG: hypothetical protein ACXITV_04935 [Luteibaculaceae bacterium]
MRYFTIFLLLLIVGSNLLAQQKLSLGEITLAAQLNSNTQQVVGAALGKHLLPEQLHTDFFSQPQNLNSINNTSAAFFLTSKILFNSKKKVFTYVSFNAGVTLGGSTPFVNQYVEEISRQTVDVLQSETSDRIITIDSISIRRQDLTKSTVLFVAPYLGITLSTNPKRKLSAFTQVGFAAGPAYTTILLTESSEHKFFEERNSSTSYFSVKQRSDLSGLRRGETILNQEQRISLGTNFMYSFGVAFNPNVNKDKNDLVFSLEYVRSAEQISLSNSSENLRLQAWGIRFGVRLFLPNS